MPSSTRSRLRLPETGPWYQSAADHRRQRLFHAGVVPLFAGALALVLLLAFPSQDLSNKLARAERTDLLTISYLRAWLSAKPDDWPLHLTLARHLALIGRYDEALGALDAIRGSDRELRRAAEHQRLVVIERKAWSLPEDSPLRAELLAELSQAMRARISRARHATWRTSSIRRRVQESIRPASKPPASCAPWARTNVAPACSAPRACRRSRSVAIRMRANTSRST